MRPAARRCPNERGHLCPWQNEFVDSFNGKRHGELPSREWFHSRAEARCSSNASGSSITRAGPMALVAATIRRACLDSDNIDARYAA
jgi:hypothetical protein